MSAPHLRSRPARPVRALLACLLALGATACGDSADGPGPRPAVPTSDDPAFTVSGVHGWYAIGNAGTAGDDTLHLSVVAPADTTTVDVWIDERPGVRLVRGADRFALPIDIADLGPGEHEVVLAADGADVGFARATFRRTHPLYVVIATDWDFADPSTSALTFQDTLHVDHPDLKLTHFVGPYTFTDPAVDEARRVELATWVRTQADTFGDEVGLHIHPYCSFVEAAGVACITDQSTVYPTDTSGYTINLSAYSEADVGKLLTTADELFAAYDLPAPRSFRAGGWTSGAATLRALDAHGYVADSSALNWARMEEWNGVGTGVLYDWNMANWSSIGDASQPYYPNTNDPQSAESPTLAMLEIPDNAIMVDYVSVAEMVDIFDANWAGEVLTAPRTVVAGFHPASNFGPTERDRIDGICAHADELLATHGDGPVVYATMREVAAAFAD